MNQRRRTSLTALNSNASRWQESKKPLRTGTSPLRWRLGICMRMDLSENVVHPCISLYIYMYIYMYIYIYQFLKALWWLSRGWNGLPVFRQAHEILYWWLLCLTPPCFGIRSLCRTEFDIICQVVIFLWTMLRALCASGALCALSALRAFRASMHSCMHAYIHELIGTIQKWYMVVRRSYLVSHGFVWRLATLNFDCLSHCINKKTSFNGILVVNILLGKPRPYCWWCIPIMVIILVLPKRIQKRYC